MRPTYSYDIPNRINLDLKIKIRKEELVLRLIYKRKETIYI
jgi:hypothetical protein